MQSAGFRHFTLQSPNHLALATPDGRHWRRAELLEECRRLGHGLRSGSLARGGGRSGLPDTGAAAIAMALAFEAEGSPGSEQDPAEALAGARRLMSPYGVEPGQDNVFYCLDPGGSEQARALAVAALHYGHPVILADDWQPQAMLRAVQRYRVTYCHIRPWQLDELLALNRQLGGRYDLASLRLLVEAGAGSVGGHAVEAVAAPSTGSTSSPPVQ